MSLFAHIESGCVMDPQVDKTAGDYLARFSADITGKWLVVVVPDGTMQGVKASVDQNGKVTVDPNPVPPVVIPTPVMLCPGVQDIYAALQAIADSMKVPLPPIKGT